MYFGDHPPPHFHVITRSDEAAVFLIETLARWEVRLTRAVATVF
jgi:hypothetical protein